MTISNFLSKLKPHAEQQEHPETEHAQNASVVEKEGDAYDDSPIPYLTWRTFVLGIVASMGGFIFGYATGWLPSISASYVHV